MIGPILRIALISALTVLLLPGSATAVPIVRDLGTDPAEFVAYGSASKDRLGLSMTMGDINSDGRADVMSGAPLDERPGDADFNRGALHVYFGAPGFSGSRDSSQPGSPDLIIYGAQGTSQGQNNGDSLGKSVAVGDVNGDGKNDLVVGAVRADAGSNPDDIDVGKVYVFYQHTHTPWPSLIDLLQTPGSADVVIVGKVKSGDFGIHLALGDFDGDGFDDILGGAPADTVGSEPGAVHVVYGAGNLPSLIDLDAVPVGVRSLSVTGEVNGDKLGHGVATGDVNGDGIDDILAGAPNGGGPCGKPLGNVGKSYVLFGSSVVPPTGTRSASTADLRVLSPQADDQMGRRLEAGDLNGNGVDDLILGARCADGPGGRTDSGALHVLFGPVGTGARDLATNPANATVFGAAAEDQLGIGPGSGDLDGNGVEDLIAGGDQESVNGGGTTVVVNGPLASGVRDLANNPADVTLISPDPGDRMGRFVAAGDVNGNGVADLGVTAYFAKGPNNTAGETGEFYVLTSLGGPAPSPSPTPTPSPSPTPTSSPTPSPSPSPSPSPTSTPGCTITGTSGDDVLAGTTGDDVICAGGGNDKVNGRAGNDTVLGEAGNDTLRGEGGNDTVNGGSGSDSLNGGDGDDSLNGVDQVVGNDTLDGGAGTDACQADVGDSVVNCEGGPTPTPTPSPSPSPSPTDCTMSGTSGNDVLNGGSGDDVICGLGGDDKIKGNSGNDVLRGQEGNDTINSEDGVVGNDSIDGGPGTDNCTPDPGDSVVGCEG
jgi:Ca2+-binding RTX toxin-like protein